MNQIGQQPQGPGPDGQGLIMYENELTPLMDPIKHGFWSPITAQELTFQIPLAPGELEEARPDGQVRRWALKYKATGDKWEIPPAGTLYRFQRVGLVSSSGIIKPGEGS